MNIINNKYFKYSFLAFLFFDALSFLSHTFPFLTVYFFVLSICLCLFLCIRNIEYIVYLPIAELIIGSQGHLLDVSIFGFSLSFRIALFVLAFLVGVFHIFKNKFFNFKNSKYFSFYLVYLFVLVLGVVVALLKGRSLGNIFFDLNGYLFFLILPIFYFVFSNKKVIENLFYILLSGTLFFSLKTIFIFYIFSHHFQGVDLMFFYKWIRDLRVGEITRVNDNFFRTFFQSQIYEMFAFLVAMCILCFKKDLIKKDKIFLYIISVLNLGAVIISFSRSYWVGLFASLGFLLVIMISKKINFRQIAISYLKISCTILASILLVFLLVKIPYTNTRLDDLLNKRLTQSEAASNSRMELLPHMLDGIKSSPIFGHGFGYGITYNSKDPRNLNKANPTGQVTTYSFEWGWLNFWLKLGIFGFLFYFILILKLIVDSVKVFEIEYWGIILSLIALSFTHIFSPYLDHPLGIGLLILAICIIDNTKIHVKN